MRVVFMGTPEFAVPSLHAVLSQHDVIAVYTAPDRVRSRGSRLVPSAVKVAAVEADRRVEQPVTFKDPSAVETLRSLAPDVICVAAYGLILPREVLEIPHFGCINVHASLLPRHRGAAPIHRAILDGDEEAGVVIMRMEEGLDTGPYTHPVAVPVDDHTVDSLTELLANEGAMALTATLTAIESGSVSWTPQDDSKATYAAKIADADVHLRPDLPLVDALRRVRASSRSARSSVVIAGTKLDVVAARAAQAPSPTPGQVTCTGRALLIGFADGAMQLLRIRPEGRSEMDGHAYVCGARVSESATWMEV